MELLITKTISSFSQKDDRKIHNLYLNESLRHEPFNTEMTESLYRTFRSPHGVLQDVPDMEMSMSGTSHLFTTLGLCTFSSHSYPQNVPDMEISVPFFSNSGTIILAAIIIVIIEMVLTTDFPPLRLVRRNLKILDPKSPRAKLGTICSSFWDVPRQK